MNSLYRRFMFALIFTHFTRFIASGRGSNQCNDMEEGWYPIVDSFQVQCIAYWSVLYALLSQLKDDQGATVTVIDIYYLKL